MTKQLSAKMVLQTTILKQKNHVTNVNKFEIESEIEDDSGDDIAISSPQYIPSWTKDLPMYGVAEIKFSGESVVSDEVKSCDPLSLFELIFIEELCRSIAEMTNLYTENLIAKNKGHLSSHLTEWKMAT